MIKDKLGTPISDERKRKERIESILSSISHHLRRGPKNVHFLSAITLISVKQTRLALEVLGERGTAEKTTDSEDPNEEVWKATVRTKVLPRKGGQ